MRTINQTEISKIVTQTRERKNLDNEQIWAKLTTLEEKALTEKYKKYINDPHTKPINTSTKMIFGG